jgi:hypothetical protein
VEIYDPEIWHEFFAVTGGSAAVLAGLVFVAMSINSSLITKDLLHRYRAIGTLSGFISVFLMCTVGLLGRQTFLSLGTLWLIISAVTLAIYINGIVQARKGDVGQVRVNYWHIILGVGVYLAQIVGSIIMLSGGASGVYIVTMGMLLSLVYMISGPWLLFVAIAEEEHKKK